MKKNLLYIKKKNAIEIYCFKLLVVLQLTQENKF